jgi:OOP family OmpA-OmpF porin
MKKITVFIVTVALLIFVSMGYAQINPRSFSVTPFFGGYTFEGNENIDTSAVYGLRAGYNFTKHWGVEGFFNYVPANYKDFTGGNDDIKLYGYGAEALYHFMPEKRLVPFLAVGAGGTHYSPDAGNNSNKFTVDYGAGLKFFLTDWVALRADVRHVLPLNDRFNDLLYTFGINFAFGGAKKTEAVQTVQEQPAPPPPPPPVEQPAPKEEMKPEAQAEPEILEKGRITLNVQFDTGKAIIKKTSYKDIDKLVDVMKQYPDLNVTIEGHTDNVGKAAGNKKLSQKRADAVKAYMVKSGIESNRITAKGYGMTVPIADNKTEDGRAQNRRTEVTVLN